MRTFIINLVRIFIPALLLVSVTACTGPFVRIVSDDGLSTFDPTSAYIVIGQKLSGGNLNRMSVALHVGGRLIWMKGIQLPGTSGRKIYWGAKYSDLKTTGADGHAYRVWEIPAKHFRENGRAFAFVQMVAAGKLTYTLKYPFGYAPCMHCAPIAPIDIQSGDQVLKTFTGCAFLMEKPGVYYLGEIELSGNLVRKDNMEELNIETVIATSPEAARNFILEKGVSAPFIDASRAWGKRPATTLGYYMAGKPTVEYHRP